MLLQSVFQIGIKMRNLIFLSTVKHDGIIYYKSSKEYDIEYEDRDSFFVKDELGVINPVYKACCNLLYMINEESNSAERYNS